MIARINFDIGACYAYSLNRLPSVPTSFCVYFQHILDRYKIHLTD